MPWNAPAMNGLSSTALAKTTKFGAADGVDGRASARRLRLDGACPCRATASILMPARVRADVDRGADHIGHGKRLGDRVDQAVRAAGHALLHQGGEAADEVDAEVVRRAVERLCQPDIVLGRRRAADLRDRRDRNALVDDRDAVELFDALTAGNEVAFALDMILS